MQRKARLCCSLALILGEFNTPHCSFMIPRKELEPASRSLYSESCCGDVRHLHARNGTGRARDGKPHIKSSNAARTFVAILVFFDGRWFENSLLSR